MIGIIGAMSEEISHFSEIMENKETKKFGSLEFISGKIYGKDVVCAMCGIGKVFAAVTAQTMILCYKPDMIINTGVAGSLTDELKVFDVAVGTASVQYDFDTTAFGDPLGLIPTLNTVKLPCDPKITDMLCVCADELKIPNKRSIIATADRFLEDDGKKSFLREHFGASACEMEGGSIGQVCVFNKVPYGIIRCISDSSGGTVDYNEFMERSAKISACITELFIKNI